MKEESIHPGVTLPDGSTFYPPSWMYLAAFAIAGCPWAVAMAERGEIDEARRRWEAELMMGAFI